MHNMVIVAGTVVVFLIALIGFALATLATSIFFLSVTEEEYKLQYALVGILGYIIAFAVCYSSYALKTCIAALV